MPEHNSYDYALIRVVPSVERGERINVGVIVFSRTLRFLGVLVHLDRQRLLALAPHIDVEGVQEHLDTMARIGAGDPAGGPIAALSQSERFHWLVSPRSTIIQPSAVHCGLCTDPEATLHHLFDTMVRTDLPSLSRQG
ncbi:Protein of unknown function (DUF3037) [Thermosporothrix hazakensis]|jgi:hypothetical protein|uniref:DUF3037 family protein n=2 Tax=Thermosporothrix TaxID=768650 RepID=A0A326U697_THEHA|nr:DUF3037 domain-containing protein [Thermosporothrix hazakensis]PZW25706.1 Protein of unknown function (DUF3037) [Thermosporothrix hazakensis]BBH90001.1 hypothetical protein KTC_47520 [Thermosporothrix sp. COM3]GCE48201.1 hypothetical protein KTH_30700 [Thermosporothrix hazakensis]